MMKKDMTNKLRVLHSEEGKDNSQKSLEEVFKEAYGRADNFAQGDGLGFLVIPRDSIEHSENAVRWFADFLEAFKKDNEENGNGIEDHIMDSLNGVYLVFRDCSLMAKHYSGFRDTNAPRFKDHDYVMRFKRDENIPDRVNMDLGYLPEKKGNTQ